MLLYTYCMGEIPPELSDESLEDELSGFYGHSKSPTALDQFYRDLKLKFQMSDEEIEEFLRELPTSPT